MSEATVPRPAPLPVGSVGRASLGWWGMLCVIATEALLFVYLLFGYFYYAVQLDGNWLPQTLPSFRLSLPGVILLVVSSAGMWVATFSARRGRLVPLLLGVLFALLLGIAFFVLQLLDWRHQPMTLRSGEYGATFFTLTGLHLAHLAVGLVGLLLLLVWSALRYFDARRHAPVLIMAAYWYFVVAVGVAVFLALYVVPRIG